MAAVAPVIDIPQPDRLGETVEPVSESDGIQFVQFVGNPDLKMISMLLWAIFSKVLDGELRYGVVKSQLEGIVDTREQSAEAKARNLREITFLQEKVEQELKKQFDLTAREIDILRELADGLSNQEIGRKLWLAEQTVKFHLTNIYRKMGVRNRIQAVTKAQKLVEG